MICKSRHRRQRGASTSAGTAGQPQPDVVGGAGSGCRDPVPGSNSVDRVLASWATSSTRLIVLAAVFAIVVVFGLLAVIVPVIGGAGDPVVGVIVVPLAYFPYFWAKSGQTPGMKIVNIKVVRDKDGGPDHDGPGDPAPRSGFWVSGLVFYLGYIWIFIDKRQRGWFDLIAGTVVIKA